MLLVRDPLGRWRGDLVCFGGSHRVKSLGLVGVGYWLLMWKGEKERLCGRSWEGSAVREGLGSEVWRSCCC